MDGKALKVSNPKDFERVVMPKFFTQTKMKSFQRQLISHGFHRIPGGQHKGCYIHKLFVRRNVTTATIATTTISSGTPAADDDTTTAAAAAAQEQSASVTKKQSPAVAAGVTPKRSTAAAATASQQQPLPRRDSADPFERLLDMVTDPADTSPASLSSSSGTTKK